MVTVISLKLVNQLGHPLTVELAQVRVEPRGWLLRLLDLPRELELARLKLRHAFLYGMDRRPIG